jgi:hypothetical protein
MIDQRGAHAYDLARHRGNGYACGGFADGCVYRPVSEIRVSSPEITLITRGFFPEFLIRAEPLA